MSTRKASPSTSKKSVATTITLEKIMNDVAHLIQIIYQGNGQEPILPRLARIEEALENAAEQTKTTAEELAKATKATSDEVTRVSHTTAESIKSLGETLGEKIDTLTSNVNTLTTSVNVHHKSMHLSEMIKSTKFWFGSLIIFVTFHWIATELETNGVHWWNMLMKFLGF